MSSVSRGWGLAKDDGVRYLKAVRFEERGLEKNDELLSWAVAVSLDFFGSTVPVSGPVEAVVRYRSGISKDLPSRKTAPVFRPASELPREPAPTTATFAFVRGVHSAGQKGVDYRCGGAPRS